MIKKPEIGMTWVVKSGVTRKNTAAAMGSGDMEVYATPAMAAFAENAAMNALAPYMEEGETTVGTLIEMNHIKASRVGTLLTAVIKLREINGRRFIFDVTVRDSSEVIGEGKHVRYLVDREKFLANLE